MALCPSCHAFYSSLVLIYIPTNRPGSIWGTLSLSLEQAAERLLLLQASCTVFFFQVCVSQGRLKGTSSKLMSSAGPQLSPPSRVYFVPVKVISPMHK